MRLFLLTMKPSLPSGTRDFSAEQVAKRRHIFNIIQSVFERYGYQPLETPVMENMSTLSGKYGEEGDRLLFRILNQGDFMKDFQPEANLKQKAAHLCKRGLRYDLTIPFARYVAMNHHQLVMPYKRYQIQPVWRGDSPQRGRYREFYQCDVDVVGSKSMLNEAELLQIYDEAFSELKIAVRLHLYNRKLLQALSEVLQKPEKLIELTVSIDKYDKIGWLGVAKELAEEGFAEQELQLVELYLSHNKGSNQEKMTFLSNFFGENASGREGLTEIANVFEFLEGVPFQNEIVLDISLARGLTYYTGCIFEVKAVNAQIGSLGGGGRYDNLTALFGLPNITGVGVSFGAERIYDVMQELNLFPETLQTGTEVLLASFDAFSLRYAVPLAKKLRAAGIRVEVFADESKIKRKFEYADRKKIPFVIVIGSDEMETGLLTVKDLNTGEQSKLNTEQIIKKLKKQAY